MKIVLTGGGSSAGHITPNLAIAQQLKKIDPSAEVIYIGHRGDTIGDIATSNHDVFDAMYTVRAGKFRRYHTMGLRQVLDIKTTLKNIRDVWWVFTGIVQSYFLLRKLKPDCVFVKGSYIGLVVGLAAAARHVPYITHDSDATPGLGNRVVARWAAMHAVALSREIYPYPQEKIVTVGIPIQSNFKPVTPTLQKSYKKELGFTEEDEILFITGGGQGAQRLNLAVVKTSSDLFEKIPHLYIIHLAGHVNEADVRADYEKVLTDDQMKRVEVKGYASDLYRYSGAADVVVTRAGATSMAEFAIQGKACVMVPNPYLTGGQQTKNAKFLTEEHAVVSVSEDDIMHHPEKLAAAVIGLFNDDKKRHEYEVKLTTFAHPNAAKELAMLLLKQAA